MMETCTKTEYARLKGVSPAAITKAIAARRVVVLPDGRVDVRASNAAWEKRTDAVQSARANAKKRRARVLRDEAAQVGAGMGSVYGAGSGASVGAGAGQRLAGVGAGVSTDGAVVPVVDAVGLPAGAAGPGADAVGDSAGAVGTGADGGAVPPLQKMIYDFEAARAKRETHQANLAEMEERKRAGELCETSAVVMTITTIGANFRNALERVADKVADRVAAESDAHECHQIIGAEIKQALEELARDCGEIGRNLGGVGDGSS